MSEHARRRSPRSNAFISRLLVVGLTAWPAIVVPVVASASAPPGPKAGCPADLGDVVLANAAPSRAGAPTAVRPLADLLERVRAAAVTFNLTTEGAGDQATFALAVRRGPTVLGSFLILEDESVFESPVPTYETHAMLGARGVGLGAMLYVLAARVIHVRGGILNSTDVSAQAPDAIALWKRLEAFGWAERTPGRNRYRVRPDLLRAGFFDAVDAALDTTW